MSVRAGAVAELLSIRLRWFGVILTLLVPFAHVSYFVGFLSSHALMGYAFAFWRRGVVTIAVESFLIVSGYLFFVSYVPSWQCYTSKIRRRVKTVVLPYLIWVSVGAVVEIVKMAELPDTMAILKLMGVRNRYPSVVSLWYLRDLFILCLLSPVWYSILRYRWLGAILLAGLSALQWVPLPWYLQVCRFSLWFVLGGYIALHVPSARLLTHYRPSLLLVLWLAGTLVSTLLLARRSSALQSLEPVYVVVGCAAVWNAASQLESSGLGRWLSRHTFFIFCSHGSLQRLAIAGMGRARACHRRLPCRGFLYGSDCEHRVCGLARVRSALVCSQGRMVS